MVAKCLIIRDIYTRYWERCRQAGAWILMICWYILISYFVIIRNIGTLSRPIPIYTADEYQDTNYAQHSIVPQLTKENQHVCAVGDDAQSIYSFFVELDIDNILYLLYIFEYESFLLEQNYRSTQTIVLKPQLDRKNELGM